MQTLFTLPNSLPVVFYPLHDTKRDVVSLSIKIGPDYELPELAGISYFLREVLLQGTKRFPTPDDREHFLEQVEAQVSVAATRGRQTYTVALPSHRLPAALEYLSEIVLHPCLRTEDIEEQRVKILGELDKYGGYKYEGEAFLEWVWGKTQAMGRPLLGYRKTVQAISDETIRQYHREFFHPGNMVLSIVGTGEKKNIEHKVQKWFRLAERQNTMPHEEKAVFTPKADPLRVIPYHWQKTHLNLGYITGISETHPDRLVMRLLVGILGEELSEGRRLQTELIAQGCSPDFIAAESWVIDDSGLLHIYGDFPHKSVRKAIDIILGEVQKLREEPVSAQELQVVKDADKEWIKNRMLNPEALAEELALSQLFEGRAYTFQEAAAGTDKITPSDIQRVAKTFLTEDNLAICITGQVNTHPKEANN